MDHDEWHQRASELATACAAARMDLDSVTAELTSAGWDARDAAIGAELVASAFGWIIVQRMGVRDFNEMFVLEPAHSDPVEISVGGSRLFAALLQLAHEVFTRGYADDLSKDAVGAIVAYSGEASAVSQALEAEPDTDLAAARLTTRFYGFSEDEFRRVAGYID